MALDLGTSCGNFTSPISWILVERGVYHVKIPYSAHGKSDKLEKRSKIVQTDQKMPTCINYRKTYIHVLHIYITTYIRYVN